MSHKPESCKSCAHAEEGEQTPTTAERFILEWRAVISLALPLCYLALILTIPLFVVRTVGLTMMIVMAPASLILGAVSLRRTWRTKPRTYPLDVCIALGGIIISCWLAYVAIRTNIIFSQSEF